MKMNVNFPENNQTFNADAQTEQTFSVSMVESNQAFQVGQVESSQQFNASMGEIQTIGGGDVQVSVEEQPEGVTITVKDASGTESATVRHPTVQPLPSPTTETETESAK